MNVQGDDAGVFVCKPRWDDGGSRYPVPSSSVSCCDLRVAHRASENFLLIATGQSELAYVIVFEAWH